MADTTRGVPRALLLGAIAALGVAAAALFSFLPAAGPSQAGRPAGSPEAGIRPVLAMASFSGYPGQAPRPGAPRLEVDAVASAPGLVLAAGSAGGYPAIWKLDAGGRWILVTALDHLPAGIRGAVLTSLAHGPAGWLAVGAPGPVVLSSQDGTTWRPAAGGIAAALGKVSVVSAAAGPRGYVILGKLVAPGGGGCVADVWWSPDLARWTRAHDVNDVTGSSQTLAVAALPAGFVSVGSHDGHPAAWVTSDGTAWRTIVLPGPPDAELNQVALAGTRVVSAGGSDGQGAGAAAFTVSSADGGLIWQDEVLQIPQPGTVITALAAGPGLAVAAGQYGEPGRGQVAVWELLPGRDTWTRARIAGLTARGPAREITALHVAGTAVTGIGPAASAASWQAAIVTLQAP